MAEFPVLPFFTDAYLADTRHLTAAQHGAYLLLLMTAWRSTDCRLPDDDNFLARAAAMDIRTWRVNKAVVMAFWKKDEQQKWCQGRLEDERKNVEQMRSKNVAAGKVSALKRKERHSTTVTTKPQQDSNPLNPSLNPSLKEDNLIPPKPPLPDWLPVAEWDGFLEMRRKIKKPPTERAQDLLIGKLTELRKQGHDPTAVIQQSIRNSWQDLFPLRQQTRNYTEQREENRRLERQRIGI